MASARVERLIKATAALEAAIKQHQGVTGTIGRNTTNYDKERSACIEIRDILVSSDYVATIKDDKRYSSAYTKAVDALFKLIQHSDSSVRTLAEESLDTSFRHLILSFHHSRLIVILITEVSKNGPARSLVAAFNRLVQVVHLLKSNRIVSYSVHIVNALTAMLKRPEDSVHNALIHGIPTLFGVIGPRIRDQHVEKVFELYRVAADNLNLPGTSNRAAFTVIVNVCAHYTSLLKKAVARCVVNIRRPDETDGKQRIVGSLNVIKGIWSLAVEKPNEIPTESLQSLIVGVLLCLHSRHNDIIMASLETLEQIMSCPLEDMAFNPAQLPNKFAPESRPSNTPSERDSVTGSPGPESINGSMVTSPLGSVLDLSAAETLNSGFNRPLDLPERPSSSSSTSDSEGTEQGEIIDPLLHADLYEEQQQEDVSQRPEAEGVRSPSPNKQTEGIPLHLPEGFCSQSVDAFTYSALLIARKFLLAGIKGLKNDREVRISMKMLALNCLTTISNSESRIGRAVVIYSDLEQPLLDVARFVLHDDDQLCSAALTFISTCDRLSLHMEDRKLTEMFPYCVQRIVNAFQPIRRRALLQATCGAVKLMEHHDLFGTIARMAVESVNSNFFLLKTSIAEWIALIEWSKVSAENRDAWQMECLHSFIHLLYSSDPKVENAVAVLVPQLVRNANLGQLTSIFHIDVPDDIVGESFEKIPMVVGMPSTYSFRNEHADFTIEENLEVVLAEMFHLATTNPSRSSSGLISGLSYLVDVYHPTIFANCWQNISKSSSGSAGLLTAVVDIAESSTTSPQSLVRSINVIASLFAGEMEGQMMRVLKEQLITDRKALPRQLNVVLTDRLLLLPIRVLNVYYSLVAEHRSTLTQSTSGILSRPNVAINNASKAKTSSHSRIADISRLLGTSVHPTKSSSFLECPALKAMYPQIRGSYANFLEKLGLEQERRFTELLCAALDMLSSLLEMLTYQVVRPFLDELLLYLKVVFELLPAGCTRLLHQLFKLVFGKNAANINLDTLQQLTMKHPLPPSDLMDGYILQAINEFTLFSAFLCRTEFVEVYVRRHIGWLKPDVLAKVHTQSNQEISHSLQLFEGFVTSLIHTYQSFNNIPTKKSILGIMCELPMDGVNYELADPNKGLLEAVFTQVTDMQSAHTSMLSQAFMFFVIMARCDVIPWTKLEELIVDVLDKANDRNAHYALSAFDVVVCEDLFVRRKSSESLWEIWRSRSHQFAAFCPASAANIWTLFLHFARKEDSSTTQIPSATKPETIHNKRWLDWSLEMWQNYSDFLSHPQEHTKQLASALLVTLSCLHPQTFIPVDSFFTSLKNVLVENEEWTAKERLSRSLPLIFTLITSMSEDKILVRSEQLMPNPVEFIVRHVYQMLWKATCSLRSALPADEDLLVLCIQLLSHCVRSDLVSQRLPRLHATLKFYTAVEPSTQLIECGKAYPRVLVHWMWFLASTPSAVPTFIKILCSEKCLDYVKIVSMMLFSDLLQEESLSTEQLKEIFERKGESNIALTFLNVADKRLRQRFIESLTDEQLEIFVKGAAESSAETLNVKVSLDVLFIADSFCQRFDKLPCADSLKRMLSMMSPYAPQLQEIVSRYDALSCLAEQEPASSFGQSLLDGLADCDELVDFFKSCVKNPDHFALEVLLRNIVAIPPQNIYYIFENISPSRQAHFLTLCLQEVERHVLMKSVEAEEQSAAVCKGQELLDIIFDFVSNCPRLSLHLYSSLRPMLIRTNLTWPDFKKANNAELLKYCTELVKSSNFDLLGPALEGLQFYFSSPSVVDFFRKEPFLDLTALSGFILSLAEAHEKVFHSPFIRPEVVPYEIFGTPQDSQLYKDLDDLFQAVQYIVKLYHKKRPSNWIYSDSLERTVRVVFRHNVLHSMACVPETAMKMNWKVALEVRNVSTLAIPLVNIHLLCNVDILEDFTWRVQWLGWTNRKQFEDFWMSLFGVLSSTPTGTELTQENSTHYTEQILASAWAVGSLTDILLQSLLFPEPGNVACSTFIVKHREKNELGYKSKSVRQLSVIKARLTRDLEPSTVYKRNLEKTVPELSTHYGLGQLSALSLWNLSGILNDENSQENSPNKSPKKISASMSEYLMKMSCELDTGSSVRALFENYSHWFSRGLEYISLPLLSATIRSMSLLSDLFDESSSYVFLYTQMKNVFNSRIIHNHGDLGFVIYSLLKAVTVVGHDQIEPGMSELDLCKQLQLWIETGVTSPLAIVRECTLHGFLYLVQSMSGEIMRPLTQYISSFLIAEITRQLSITDPVVVHSAPSSIGYEALVWATAFRIMEEPVQGNFKINLNQKLCEVLLVVNLPSWLLEIVTSGIESLIIHSSTFSDQFSCIVKESFRDYQFHTGKFPYTLRIFIACIFREEADPTRNSFKKYQSLVEELFTLISRCDPSDAQLIAITLPAVLRRLYRDNKALDLVLDALLPSRKLQLPENTKALLVMVYELFEHLRDNQRIATYLQLNVQVVARLYECSLQPQQKAAAITLLLTASSGDIELASRFPALVELYDQPSHLDWKAMADWTIKRTAHMLVDEGFSQHTEVPDKVDLQWLLDSFLKNE